MAKVVIKGSCAIRILYRRRISIILIIWKQLPISLPGKSKDKIPLTKSKAIMVSGFYRKYGRREQ